MTQIKIKNEAPVRENVCKCDSVRAHGVLWAAIMVLTVAGTASLTYLLLQPRSVAIPVSTSERAESMSQEPTQAPASENSAIPKQYEPAKAFVEWIDVTFEYPKSWYVVSQSYLRSVDYKYSYVLTFDPMLINISDYNEPQPRYLRVSRLKSDSHTPDRIINDMREQYVKVKDEKVEIEPGMTLYMMSGEKKRERERPIQANDYFIVMTSGDGLDQFGDIRATIYYAEPKRLGQLEPQEAYDAIITQVEEILRSVKPYQQVAPNQAISKEINPPQKPIKEYVCSDTDRGTDIYTKGTLDGPELSTGAKPTDYCVLNGTTPTLVEYSCVKEHAYTSASVPCEFGCADGACLRAP